ncbi:hypothetical protein V1264_017606 [Littorina saxatilis]|uniref:Ig-like domain-containing protein n=1 Tax=Littorina saxatilis TaxID=31220 RepID=A0AAN9GGW9_9CAEN
MQETGVKVSWLGRSPHALLSLPNVQRGDHGSSYTCLVTAAGRTLNTRYTLRVAYGPSNEHLTLGPADLITNGSHSLSLTCNATYVYPTPDYLWSGITCDNGTADNVCVFTPDPTTDDLNDVTCTAVGSYGDGMYWQNLQSASKTIQLNVLYPPAQKPVIQQQTTEPQFLQIGDNLTCTVAGGKPLVDSVHFYCTNPDLPDKEDARSASSVSSSVTVKTVAGITDTHMTCYCNATWGTKAEYYTLCCLLQTET